MREVDQELFDAAQQGNLSRVKRCINQRANVYAKNTKGVNAFHAAAANGHKDIVEFFLDERYCRAYVSIVDAPGITITSRQGVSVDNAGTDGCTSLHYASRNGELEVVKFLVGEGANIYAKRSTDGCKALHIAAMHGHKDVVEFFLDQGLRINTTGEIGFTLLHYAAQEGRSEVVKFLLERGANANVKNECGERPIDVARRKGHSSIVELLSPYESCVILSTHSEKKQQEVFLRLSEFVSHNFPNTSIKSVKQGLYLPSFKERGVEINGKCVAITRSLSQALLLQGDKSFLSNLETSAKIYERIAQGKQISKREEKEVFAFSKLLSDFERQLDSATNSLPSNLIHTKGYKTLDGLSNYIAEIKGDFAIHLVTSNHVVAIYRIGDNYVYFDSNAAFVSGLKSVDQLMQIVEKAVESAGYKVEEKGFLVEHFDVNKANNLLFSQDKQILAKEIKTEHQLLAEQDKELGLIKINGQELSRVQLYDFGTKINVEGSVPLLINAGMNLNSKKFQELLDKKEVSMTAREYLDNLKNSKNVEEVAQATKVIPFIGSEREIEEAEQARKPEQFVLERLVKGTINSILAAVSLANISRSESQLPGKTDNRRPRTCLNDPIVDNQLQRSQGFLSCFFLKFFISA